MCVLVLAEYDQNTHFNSEVRACYLLLTPLKECFEIAVKKKSPILRMWWTVWDTMRSTYSFNCQDWTGTKYVMLCQVWKNISGDDRSRIGCLFCVHFHWGKRARLLERWKRMTRRCGRNADMLYLAEELLFPGWEGSEERRMTCQAKLSD